MALNMTNKGVAYNINNFRFHGCYEITLRADDSPFDV